MQHVPANQALLDDYIGAQITIENFDEGVFGRKLARGTISGITILSSDIRVLFTCSGHAIGALDSHDTITWHPSPDSSGVAYLSATIHRADDGTLHFRERSGSGPIALITPADALDEAA